LYSRVLINSTTTTDNMLPQHVLVALVAAVSAVPLNINLGAYSPALVVGDGEISLGGAEGARDASALMATLASGANAGGEGGQAAGQQQQQAAEQPAEQPAAPQEGEQPAEENAARRDIAAPNVKREAEPTVDEHLANVESALNWIKRDPAGFKRSFTDALTYAREAMQNTPKIELGTEAAGVGILQNAGLNVPANSAANGAGPGRAKRSEVIEDSEAPKMTLVAITEV
jgi:type IV secretory pathway TrbL component